MTEQLDCMKFCLGDEEPTESFWVRIKKRTGKGNITVGVSYQSPEQEEEADEALHQQIQAASHSQALMFMGDFHPMKTSSFQELLRRVP